MCPPTCGPWRVPLPGAIKTYTKAAQQAKGNLMPLLIEVFGIHEPDFLEEEISSRSLASSTAVDDVSFKVEQGEVLTLLGPSGCGKTTTLRMVAGLEQPDAGEIDDRAAASWSARSGHLRAARTSATSAWCSSPTRSGRT